MAKPSKLEMDYEYEFHLIAMVSSSKEYKLAWHLNKELNISLAKEPDLEYNLTKGRRFLVSNFLFDAEYSSFRLLKNKALESSGVAKPFVIPELKQYDYLLKIDTELSVEEINVYLSQIKLMQQVQLVELVNIEKLTSKENLLF